MKQRHSIGLFIAVLGFLALPDTASAYLKPKIGRWLSRDPQGELGAMVLQRVPSTISFVPQGHPFLPRDADVAGNAYVYVYNAPANGIDPDGRIAMFFGGVFGKPKPQPGGPGTPPGSQPGDPPAGRGATCGIKIKRSAICTPFPIYSCDLGHEWIEGGGLGRWDFPKDYGEDPCHEWDRNHPVREWNAHVKLVGESLPDGTSCAQASCSQISACLQKQEDEWQRRYDSGEEPYDFLFHNCINFVDAALSKCCMSRGALPTRVPRPFEEHRLCCERRKEMERLGCNERIK